MSTSPLPPPAPRPRTPRWRVRLAVACCAIVGVVVGAEFALRTRAPVAFLAPLDGERRGEGRLLLHRASDVPGLVYELAPSTTVSFGASTIHVNALGLRGPEVELAKPAGVRRILAIGDSVTFGWDLPDAATWPRQLEATLAAHVPAEDTARAPTRPTWQVWNAGVSGYGTRDEAIALEQRAAAFEPDVAVVAYFLNDPETLPFAPLRRAFESPPWWRRWHLVRLVEQALYHRDLDRHGGGDFYRYLHAPDGPCWPRELEALDRLAAVARERVPRTLVVVFPAYPPLDSWERYPWSDVHARVVAACRERGLPVLDLVPAFVASSLAPRAAGVDSEHPNAAGNAVAARAVAAELERRGWLEEPRVPLTYAPR